MQHILVTGAAGYLGAEIVHRLLKQGVQCELLTRPASVSRAEALFVSAVQSGAARIVPGDIALPGCGIDDAGRTCGRLDAAIHLAAIAKFAGHSLDAMRRVNVEGSIRAFDLAEQCGASSFFHFSTAYVAGQTSGNFGEDDLDVGQAFRNHYERTKFEAECALKARAENSPVSLTIVRPSLVAGEGHAGPGQGRGLFGIVEICKWLRGRLDRDPNAVREFRVTLPGRAETPVNIVSVSEVAGWFLKILETPELHGGCWHLVNSRYATVAEIKEGLENILGFEGIRLAENEGRETSERETQLARIFKRKLAPYLPYFSSGPRFDRRRLNGLVGTNVADESDAHFLLSATGLSATPPPNDEFDRYFREFIPSRIDDPAFHEVRSLDEIVEIRIADRENASWRMRFRCGEFQLLENELEVAPRCVFSLTRNAFESIVACRIAPQAAFFDKSIQISGDVFFALKLASLLEGFFRRNPCTLETAAA